MAPVGLASPGIPYIPVQWTEGTGVGGLYPDRIATLGDITYVYPPLPSAIIVGAEIMSLPFLAFVSIIYLPLPFLSPSPLRSAFVV